MTPDPKSPPKPELLAPAGDWDCAAAAVEHGADAIYFGLDVGFNARARATNFHLDDLPRLMDLLHRNGVLGYVTLNTLVFTDELAELEKNVRMLAEAGVDAVIVQDVGAARLIRAVAPTLAIHGSTQMTVTSAETLAGLAELELERIVLARELSIKEIAAITAASDVSVEVFVHGALCVAYSGQCLTSESLGGRSANRGQCAQACRLDYRLLCDGQPQDLGDNRYLLSPLDLAAHDLIPALVRAGVASFKIEGRLKSPEYVASVVTQYRRGIDAAAGGDFRPMSDAERDELQLSFSRGFAPGWLEGCDHKRLVPGLSSSKRGVRVGTVRSVRGDRIEAVLARPLAKGDGIVVEGDRAAGAEVGGHVWAVQPAGGDVCWLTLPRGAVPAAADLAGRAIYLTHSPEHARRWRLRSTTPQRQGVVPLKLRVEACPGRPLRVEVSPAAEGKRGRFDAFTLESEGPLEPARKLPASSAMLREQFDRLGGTPYAIGGFEATIESSPMVPLSVLGELRRRMLERLSESVEWSGPHACRAASAASGMLAQVKKREASTEANALPPEPRLHVLCRSPEQIPHLLHAGVGRIYAEFHDIRGYAEAVSRVREASREIYLVPLRIQKPGEVGLLRNLLKRNADGWLVRNLAAVEFACEHGVAAVGDFALNVTNPLSAEFYFNKGLRAITASYDLNRDQLADLVDGVPRGSLEVVVHQHMPMFHMEHCVFCTVLSPGTNKTNCGRPCDRHLVQLRDRVGTDHFLDADIGCRNTLYNGRPQSGAEAVAGLIARGVRDFRIELLPHADAAMIENVVGLYQRLLRGELAGGDVWKTLKADNRIGVTRGTMEQKKNPLAIL